MTIKILLLLSLFLLNGCGLLVKPEPLLYSELPKSNKGYSNIDDFSIKIEKSTSRKLELPEKLIKLVEPKSKKEVLELELKSIGLYSEDEIYQNKLKDIARNLARGDNGYDQKMIPHRIGENGEIIEGRPRIVLSEKELVDRILSIKAYDTEIELPIYIDDFSYSVDDLVGIEEKVIGYYQTKFNPNVAGRSENVYLSAKALNKLIVGPGDRLSFNEVVGQRTVARGYKTAKEIVNGEFVDGIGGGVCQTSSTLYNAVDEAGMKMIEHHNHSKDVGYVPVGRDATVSWGGPDFVFENPYDFPVIIKTFVDKSNGILEVTITTSTYNSSLIK